MIDTRLRDVADKFGRPVGDKAAILEEDAVGACRHEIGTDRFIKIRSNGARRGIGEAITIGKERIVDRIADVQWLLVSGARPGE